MVNQSCRGTFGSGGDFDPFSQEIDDGADTVAWLRQQAWFGGRFALCGASYLGYTAWAIMTDPPPELVTAVIAVAAHDNYWVTHGAGAFALEGTLALCDGFDHLEDGMIRGLPRFVTASRRLKPGYEELPLVRAQETVLAGSRMPYREWLTATDADDPVWQPMRLGQALERVDVPVLLHEGWHGSVPRPDDRSVRAPAAPRRRCRTDHRTLDPCRGRHQGRRNLDGGDPGLAGASTSPAPVAGAGPARSASSSPAPRSGATCRNGHQPPTERVLYLQPDGGLGATPPTPTAGPSTFVYDPADPTPAVGGRVINPAIAGHRDNRELEKRDDVLTFTGPPLSEPLEVIGNPVVELVHRTDNPYVDLFVRLCEVRKNGRSINVSDGFHRLEPDESSGTIRIRLEAIGSSLHPRNPDPPAGFRRCASALRPEPGHRRRSGDGRNLAPSRRTISHGDGGFSRLRLPGPVDADA